MLTVHYLLREIERGREGEGEGETKREEERTWGGRGFGIGDFGPLFHSAFPVDPIPCPGSDSGHQHTSPGG